MAASDLLLFATKATTVVMIMRRTRTRQDNKNSMTPPQRPPLLFAALPEAFGGKRSLPALGEARRTNGELQAEAEEGGWSRLWPLAAQPPTRPAPSDAPSRTSARLLSAQNRSVSALGARRIPTKAEPSLHWPLRRRWGLPDSSQEAYSEATKTKDKKQ